MRAWTLAGALILAACGQADTPTKTSSDGTYETGSVPAMRLANPDADLDEAADRVTGSLNPFENDLRDLEVAIRLNEAFLTKPDGVEFEFKVTNSAAATPINEVFVMQPTSGIASDLLAAEQRPGFYISTYRLKDADKPRMHAADLELKALKAASTGGNELTFQAEAHTCVDPSGPMPQTYSLTLYVRTHPGVDFVTLSDEWLADRADAGPLAALFDTCAPAD